MICERQEWEQANDNCCRWTQGLARWHGNVLEVAILFSTSPRWLAQQRHEILFLWNCPLTSSFVPHALVDSWVGLSTFRCRLRCLLEAARAALSSVETTPTMQIFVTCYSGRSKDPRRSWTRCITSSSAAYWDNKETFAPQ